MESLEALIFNIQAMSTEDGPGIRTTVFMKGCNMRCLWCQNPEGLTTEIHLVHDPRRCIGCGACLENCPAGAVTREAAGLRFGDGCRKCRRCVERCPAGAIRAVGERVGMEELLVKLCRDKPFYDCSGGGVTFSGGECLLQQEFIREAVSRLKERGLHVCIDTAGHISPALFRDAVRQADLVLYDLKLIDERRHRALTGVSNRLILENAAWLEKAALPVWVRIPVIPNCTAAPENMAAAARFIKRSMGSVERIDLLGYNDLCAGDYERLRQEYSLKDTARVSESDMEQYRAILAESGVTEIHIANYRKEVQ
ncbi:MAG: glycyl-radical enzyme activating protein [Bacillota bacterium]